VAEGEVVTKLRIEGADQVKTALSQMRDNLSRVIGSVQGSKAEFTGAAASAEGFGGALGIIGQAAKAATSPLGILIISVGAAAGVMMTMAKEAVGLFKEMRELSTVTGGTVQEAEDLRDTFELAGLGTEKLNMSMFKLGMSIESGGKDLEHLGISVRGAGGEIKATGEVFEEIRNKISQIGSASERAAAAAEIFGARQARGLMPILSMSAERYAELRKKAEENTAVTDAMMDRVAKYIEVQAELNNKLEVSRIRFAELIALPVVTKFTEWAVAALNFVTLLKTAYDIAGAGMLGPLITGAAKKKQLQDKEAEDATAAAKKVDEQQAKGVQQNQRLIESELKARMERGRIQDELTTIQLKGEQAAFAEQSKMRTGSDQEAIQSRVAMNEKLIELAEQRYTRERALAEERVFKATGGRLAPEEEIKLEKERDVAIQGLRQDNAKALIEIEQARVAKSQEVNADEIKRIKAHNAEILAMVEGVGKRQIAQLEMSNRSTQEITTGRYQIERQMIQDTKNLKLIEINEEKGRLEALAEAHKGNYAIQRQVQEQIMGLSQQRVQTEQAADVQIIEQRKKMVADLQNLAREEAGIGDALTNKAIENLKKRGRTRVSEADVMQESARIQRTGVETLGAFGGGGRVSMDRLQESMAMKGTFESMAKGGFNIAGAVQQAISQAFAAFAGQRQQFAPTGTDPALMQQLGMGGGAPMMGAQVEVMESKIASSGDKAIGLMLERIPNIMEGWMVRTTDFMIRKLEFEAART